MKASTWLHLCVAVLVSLSANSKACAGVVFGNNGLNGGFRWDAAARTVGGLERSLDGGIRYSVTGGSFQAFRDSFTWQGSAPSVAVFQSTVQAAFDAWAHTDPVSGLGSNLSFVPDFGTAVNSAVVGNVRQGAEIDLFAANIGTGLQGFTNFNAFFGDVTLTSGVANYDAGYITGADITLNNNNGGYTLDIFRRLLTHEIGHAIGLGDVESTFNPGNFIDDNFNGTSNATALATLNNSWASLVNPLDPSLSPLSLYSVPDGTIGFPGPGVASPGVDILMESFGLGIAPGNPASNLFPLSNDDYGMRQFLYPVQPLSAPEPTTLGFISVAGVFAAWRIRRSRRTLATQVSG